MHLERRLTRALIAAIGCTTLLACSDDEGGGNDDSAAGGASSGGAASGGRASGGSPGTGGRASGGSPAAGGSASGGTPAAGGSGSGGDATGGSPPDGGTGGEATDGAVPEGAAPDGGDGALPEVVFTPAEWARIETLSPLPDVPASPTNAYANDANAAALGQMLFFDKSYSGPLAVASDLGGIGDTGRIACATCHAGDGMDDQRSRPSPVSIGANFHTRNAPSAINSVFYSWTNWGGRFSAPWELPLPVAESPAIMNSTRLAVAHLIFDKYRTEYETVFGTMDTGLSDTGRFPLTGKPKASSTLPDGPWELMAAGDRDIVNRIFANYGKSLEAYLRKLVSRDAPFDAFVAGDTAAISREAQLGLKLFVGDTNCATCHLGPFFSDGLFHNIGIPQPTPPPAYDDGRFKDIPGLLGSPFNGAGVYSDDTVAGQAKLVGLTNPPAEATRGTFRTPTLRGVARTAPYMHAGQMETLDDVLEHYSQGGATPVSGTLSPHLFPLSLTDDEKANLVRFMESLNGAAVPSALLQDTSKP